MPLPEYRIRLIPAQSGEEIDAGHSKLGGDPEWIQGDETPVCAPCSQEMVFVLQLDSIDDSYEFGDAGMLYVFVCGECGEGTTLMQGY